MNNNYFFFFILLLLVSCGPSYIFEEDITVDPLGWKYDQTARFEFNAPDTIVHYNLWLTINHSTEYSYENIYVNIRTEFPALEPVEQRLSLDIADKFGNWQGDCNRDRCLTVIPLQTDLRFRELGEHALEISQDTRDESLEGIHVLSLSVEKIKSKK